MKSQYDARAVAELNKELRYIVFFSGDSAALCPHMRSMVHRDKYGCDLSTSEEEQVDPMLE
jgi:hypothetical protein